MTGKVYGRTLQVPFENCLNKNKDHHTVLLVTRAGKVFGIICCHLDGLDIVRVQFEVRLPALVEGRHHRAVHVAVGQPQAVAQLVGQRLQQVCTLVVSMVS